MSGSRLIRIGVVCAIVAAAVAIVPQLGATELELPMGVTEELAQRMYTEQQDSQRNIDRLVEGEFKEFEITKRTVTPESAELEVRVTDKRNVRVDGELVLVRGGDVWYFETITNHRNVEDGTPPSELNTDPDVGVLNTMLTEQSENATVTAKLVDGTYTSVKIGEPKDGYRTMTIPVQFSGKSTKKLAGEITLIEKRENGRDYWYVVSFAEKKN